jgi:hypothetical protein
MFNLFRTMRGREKPRPPVRKRPSFQSTLPVHGV